MLWALTIIDMFCTADLWNLYIEDSDVFLVSTVYDLPWNMCMKESFCFQNLDYRAIQPGLHQQNKFTYHTQMIRVDMC